MLISGAMENAVSKAIRILGPTLFQAAVRTGIQPTTLWKWAKAGRIKDGLRAVQIARLTDGQVTVEELVGASPNGHPGDGAQAKGPLSATSPDSPATEGPLSPAYPASPGTATAPVTQALAA